LCANVQIIYVLTFKLINKYSDFKEFDYMTPQPEIFDDRGTTAGGAAEILQKMLAAFDGSKEKLAIALGRTEDEVSHGLSGNSEAFDDDLVMKMRGIAKERGINLE
jgi:hypothetical protein